MDCDPCFCVGRQARAIPRWAQGRPCCDTRFTLIKFDSNRPAVVHRAVSITAVPDLTDETYQPGAATPLIDACMVGIHAAEQAAGR